MRIIVTGGTRGIGRAIVEELARREAEVVFVGRDAAVGRAVAAELGRRGRSVRFVPGDLATTAGVRAVATALAREGSIDVLVHNAGVWPSRLERNADGIEIAFAVNHLAPFLLNHLLEGSIARGGRIVQVSAGLYIKGRVDPARTSVGDDFSSLRTYASTKLANVLLLERFAEHFAPREVTVNAVHPGVIRTDLGDRKGPLGILLRGVKRLWGTPEEGARPVVRLALDPGLARTTGAFFDRDRLHTLAPIARDPALAARLWEQASELTKLGPAAVAAEATA